MGVLAEVVVVQTVALEPLELEQLIKVLLVEQV
jgi:hypothetical protein